MPDASAAPTPAENGNGAADAAPEHSAALAAESADAATPMETESKDAAEVVKKKRTKKHAIPYRAQGVAGLNDKAVQVTPHSTTSCAKARNTVHGASKTPKRRQASVLLQKKFLASGLNSNTGLQKERQDTRNPCTTATVASLCKLHPAARHPSLFQCISASLVLIQGCKKLESNVELQNKHQEIRENGAQNPQ